MQYLITFVMFSIGMVMIRHWVAGLGKKIDSAMSKDDCDDRRAEVCRKISALKDDNDEQWTVINHHGHKGLSGEDQQVVRTEAG